jgi:uncharacterized protein
MDMRLLFFFLFACLVSGNSTFAQEASGMQTITFTLADGTELEQDVFLPEGKGPFPVVLLRTPYGKHQYEHDGRYFSARGYAAVIQDVRGKFGSTGHFIPFVHEKEDGLATLDWLVQQPWCNGQVGAYGVSYPGFCALSLTQSGHQALRAVVNSSGWVKPTTMAQPGGADHLMLNLPWLLHEETTTVRNIQDYDMDSLFRYLPLKDVFRSIGIDNSAWEDPGILGVVNTHFDYSRVDIPILHITGAYDFVKESTIGFYEEVSKHGEAPQHLILGPWFHSQSHTSMSEVGEVDFGPTSRMGDEQILARAVEWLDIHLKGGNKELLSQKPIEVFLQFANRWAAYQSWPPRSVAFTEWYIDSGNGANSLHGDGTLSQVWEDSAPKDTFTYDPATPVPTYGGANFHFFPGQLGIKDQSAIEERQDVLVYTSAVFSDSTTVAGPIRCSFYVTTTAYDTDFTAKLVLVTPDKEAWILAEGIRRMRYRHSPNNPELVVPGKIYPLNIEIGHTAFVVAPGYRLRLEVSSSNFPKYNRNTNTKEDPFTAATLQVARQTIYHSREYPSRLILPVLNN